jgi:signal transduction histidine kinase
MSGSSTRTRILLATFVPLLLFVLLGVGAAVEVIPRIIERLVLQRQTALAEVTAAGVAGEMQGHLRLLLSTADDVSAVVGVSESEDATAVQQVLARRTMPLEVFTGGVAYVDLDGTLLAAGSGAGGQVGKGFGHEDYLRRVFAGRTPAFSSVIDGQSGGSGALMVGVPVRQGGKTMGALVGTFDLQRNTWASNLNLLRTPEGGTATLIDAASTVIYDVDPRELGSKVQQDAPQLWQMVLDGEPSSRILTTAAGRREVVAYAPVPGISWGVILRGSWDAIIAQTRLSFWAIGGLWLIGLLVAALLLSLSVRRALLPLDAVVAEAHNVTEGGTFHPLSYGGPPDIRTLVDAFNRMVAQLSRQQAALRDYARRVLRGQEAERERISRDLHDETVQALVGLRQRLELAARALPRCETVLRDPSGSDSAAGIAQVEAGELAEALRATRSQLDQARALADDTLKDVRRMSYNLRPFMLEDLGLPAALRSLSQELDVQTPDVDVHYEIAGTVRKLAPDVELTIFRIVQEALHNVRKHAIVGGATHVSVALIYEDWGTLVLIEDDGPGTDLPSTDELVRQGHLGIAGMVERARLFGGVLDVVTSPGEGTTVRLRLGDGLVQSDTIARMGRQTTGLPGESHA